MLIQKKSRWKTRDKQQRKRSLYPVLYVAGSLKDYHKELVKKETDSLHELGMISSSFGGVLEEAEHFQEKLQDFGQTFSNIDQVSGEFVTVKGEISESVIQAQEEVEELKNHSLQVKTHFGEMETTFEDLQTSVKKIKSCTNKIISIADQTNILALNATIEAARAGEHGKGFAVVAMQVRDLAEEIKKLVAAVDSSIGDMEQGTKQLNSRIQTSQEALGESIDKVNETYEMFDRISQAADGATAVQTGISGAIEDSRVALEGLCGFFDRTKRQYREVMGHIKQASRLGTTKSAMFEDIDNMLSQISPIVQEYMDL